MRKYLNRYYLVLDFLIIIAIGLFVESLTLDFTFEYVKDLKLIMLFVGISIFKVSVNQFFKIYNRIWSLASIEDFIYLVYSFLFTNSIIYILIITNIIHLSFLFMLAAMFLEVCYYVWSRFFIRFYYYYKHKRSKDKNLRRTLIIGAGKAGDIVHRDVTRHQEVYGLRVVGFVDDLDYKIGKKLKNIPIYGPFNNIENIINENRVQYVIVAIPSLSRKNLSEMINKLATLPVKVKVLPRLEDIDGQALKVRNVKIEDLLGRDTIKLDDEGILDFIKDKTVLITGGGGSIGSELCRQVVKYHAKQLIIFDIYENNAYDIQNELIRFLNKNNNYETDIKVLIGSVRDTDRLDEVFSKYKPNIVFHAAAHKHVPLMEDSPKEAIKNNINGTYNTAKAAIEHNVDKFVLISTDKAVNPTNIMGSTKRLAEIIIQHFSKEGKTNFSAVRFGNVLGSNGSVIPLFKKQILEGGPVTVTHRNIIRYFMTIPEACQLVLQSGAFSKGGELFVLDMGEPVHILDLAEKMIRLSGYTPYEDIEIKFTGLRPGEKMFEELLIDENTNLKTTNERIFIENNNVKNLDLVKTINEINQDYKKMFDIVDYQVEVITMDKDLSSRDNKIKTVTAV